VGLGAFIGAGRSLDPALRRVARAEELRYESVYVTHIAGRDSITLLAGYAARTSRVLLGTG
jgi:alkanesulfonate monooxygenase SsuD/methylene tetrahydromethanopterin reductase-like flavin-dependent oxidoreductase (luciferase family)